MDALTARAAKVQLLVFDCDGVLTDGGLYYGPEGEALKRFDVKDGHGIVMARLVGLPTAVIPASRWVGRTWLGFDLMSSRPIDEVPRIAPRPALLLHGGDDTLVPPVNSERLHAALPGSELVLFPGVRHAALYRDRPEEYVRRVGDFFLRSLQHPPPPAP